MPRTGSSSPLHLHSKASGGCPGLAPIGEDQAKSPESPSVPPYSGATEAQRALEGERACVCDQPLCVTLITASRRRKGGVGETEASQAGALCTQEQSPIPRIPEQKLQTNSEYCAPGLGLSRTPLCPAFPGQTRRCPSGSGRFQDSEGCVHLPACWKRERGRSLSETHSANFPGTSGLQAGWAMLEGVRTVST